MKEEDIRPQALLEENLKLYSQDLEQLLSQRNNFVQVPCPACEANSYEPSFIKNEFDYVKCLECETTYVNPRPTIDMVRNFYTQAKSIEHWNKKLFPISEDKRREQVYSGYAEKIVDICQRFSVEGGTLVDVGAGFGTFCEEVIKRNYFRKVIAVELSPLMAATCRARGIETVEKPIEEVSLKNVDVITCFLLLEAIFCPKQFLLSCANTLKPGGLLIMTLPEMRGFDLLTLKGLSNHLLIPNHTNGFTLPSLTLLLNRCGFDVIESSTPGKLDAELVRKQILAGKLDVSKQPFLKRVLIDEWDRVGQTFQQFLADNGLSSFLWIVAQRI